MENLEPSSNELRSWNQNREQSVLLGIDRIGRHGDRQDREALGQKLAGDKDVLKVEAQQELPKRKI